MVAALFFCLLRVFHKEEIKLPKISLILQSPEENTDITEILLIQKQIKFKYQK